MVRQFSDVADGDVFVRVLRRNELNAVLVVDAHRFQALLVAMQLLTPKPSFWSFDSELYSFSRHAEREHSLVVYGGNAKVTFGYDIHPDEYIVIEIIFIIAAHYLQIGDFVSVFKAKVDGVCVGFQYTAVCRYGTFTTRNKAQRLYDFR